MQLIQDEIDYIKSIVIPYCKEKIKEFGFLVTIVVAGSYQQGLATIDSDLDLKCIFIKHPKYYLSINKDVKNLTFEIPDKQLIERFGKVEVQALELEVYLKGLYNCNPTLLEIFYAKENDILYSNEYHNYFSSINPLSLKVYYSYSAYAKAQLHKIKNHKEWINETELKEPTREDFGIVNVPRQQIQFTEFQGWIAKQYDVLLPFLQEKTNEEQAIFWESLYTAIVLFYDELPKELYILQNHWMNIRAYFEDLTLNQFHKDKNFMAMIQAEKQYRHALAEYKGKQHWQTERNARRRESELKYGYDIKHASHLCRLLTDVAFILENGKYPENKNIDFILEVRNGKISYEKLIEWTDKQTEKIDKLFNENPTNLSQRPNHEMMDEKYIIISETLLINYFNGPLT